MDESDVSRRGEAASARLPQVVIVACPDGPLLVRGQVQIVSASGRPVPRRRATVALCRCGASAIKPYCDGSHKAIGFRTVETNPT
jgi:CDGSH-type Zn-finger protein